MFFKKVFKIEKVRALEILDSRGNPTIMAEVRLNNGIRASANVPSGASTGSHEALELRDNDKTRYNGKGVKKAVENVNTKITQLLQGFDIFEQRKIDEAMKKFDATPNKANLGANAILGVSLACARAAAIAKKERLYEYLAKLYGINPLGKIPSPMMNVINGGAHSDSGLDIQEFMIIPSGANFAEKMQHASEVYATLKKEIMSQGFSAGIGDEGGFAPKLGDNTKAIELLTTAISKAGYVLGKDFNLALDCAASEFFDKTSGKYNLNCPKATLSSDELIAMYQKFQEKWPISVIEDPMAEDDFEGWKKATTVLGPKSVLIGDDLFVTNTSRLKEGVKNKMANAILIKVNQIGTLTETLDCIKMARKVNYKVIISHRSGETCDAFIADLAVAVGADFVKFGAPCRGERVAKYNRLLEIEKKVE